MITKTFKYEVQAMLYYEQVANNPHCESIRLSFNSDRNCWVVEYWYDRDYWTMCD